MNDKYTPQAKEAQFIVDSMGGTAAVAKLFGIKPSSVSDWKINGIPDARKFSIRLLRPDLFKASV